MKPNRTEYFGNYCFNCVLFKCYPYNLKQYIYHLISSKAESPIHSLCVARNVACCTRDDRAGLAYAHCPSVLLNYS